MSPTNPSPSAVRPSPGKFAVFVDHRFNYTDESQRYLLGEFDSQDAAAGACRKIVDDFLLASFKPAMSADELYAAYMAFGEVPIISPDDGAEPFSASKYARSRCGEFKGPHLGASGLLLAVSGSAGVRWRSVSDNPVFFLKNSAGLRIK